MRVARARSELSLAVTVHSGGQTADVRWRPSGEGWTVAVCGGRAEVVPERGEVTLPSAARASSDTVAEVGLARHGTKLVWFARRSRDKKLSLSNVRSQLCCYSTAAAWPVAKARGGAAAGGTLAPQARHKRSAEERTLAPPAVPAIQRRMPCSAKKQQRNQRHLKMTPGGDNDARGTATAG